MSDTIKLLEAKVLEASTRLCTEREARERQQAEIDSLRRELAAAGKQAGAGLTAGPPKVSREEIVRQLRRTVGELRGE